MERALEKTRQSADIAEFINISNKDPRAEFEARILAGRIQTRDVAERILAAVKTIAPESTEEHRLTCIYPNDIRVHVLSPALIHKVCVTKSFKDIPLNVERKTRYFESAGASRDTLDVADFFCRFSLKTEKHLKKDYDGTPEDPAAFIRVIHRQSFKVPGGEFRIDFSMVKTKKSQKEGLRDVLKNPPEYELEVEYTPRKDPRPSKEIMRVLYRVLETVLGAYQETHHILPLSDLQKYAAEFKASGNLFYNPVTLERRHIVKDRPYNILSGYTVTNKADGQRCGLFVTRDRRVVRANPNGQVVFTGLTAGSDAHNGDFLDGEYIPEKNLFCIFDVYYYKGRDTKPLPLFTTDEDIKKNPLSSRLGCARQFVRDTASEFAASSETTLRIETKLFLAGEGEAMEDAIKTILDTEFEYETDGLIFTPRASPVAPHVDTRGKTWTRVYKWKPPHQNSIDFLVKFEEAPIYDVVRKEMVKNGTLYVGRTPGLDILYPCETLTGEYVPPKLPPEFMSLADSGTRVPSVFQPAAPRYPDAYVIHCPLNDKGIPVDIGGNKVEDNTIIECSYDVPTKTWTVMRTRYDKTYLYRVLRRAEYGNDINVADSIWTSIHVPITEEMLKMLWTTPPDDTFEDDMYYRDDENSRERNQVRAFHNRVKEGQYSTYVVPGNTLLELAVGRGGDLHKWRRTKPSKVLGLDISASNINMPRQGACVRYLNEKKRSNEFLPKVLFAQADMTKPFEEQESRYLKMVFGDEPATTPYLAEFKGIPEWDLVACQFAMHYACASEEMFKTFVGNLKHCKTIFFGTVLDGQAVYSLLMGKDRHTFRSNGKTLAEITKKYEDAGQWKDEFGQQIDVLLESTVKPSPEYLVPFESVKRILAEAGLELIDSKSFKDVYTTQNQVVLDKAEQEFSFLYRTFAFKRVEKAPEPEPEPEPEAEAEPEVEKKEEATTEKKEEPKPDVAKEPVRRKKIVKKAEAAAVLPEILFFFSKEPENKEFSNFYETEFELDGVKYKSAEHAYQGIKAKTFGDEEAFEKILKAKSAQSAKAAGKKVKDFKEETWKEKKDEVMKTILRAKFTQNLELRKKLLDSGDKRIANADSRDKYWGIGTSVNTTMAKDPAKWKGENKLGAMLEELRTTIKAE